MEHVLWGALGAGAGLLTTLAGLGGGMMLVITLSWIYGPDVALASTAPALLIGNGHRAWLLRTPLFAKDAADETAATPAEPPPTAFRVAMMFSAAALPAAFVGGLVAVSVPMDVLRWLLLGVTVLALARQAGWIRWQPTAAALLPAAVLSGFLTATSGGGSLVMAPSLLAVGLRGDRYVAAGSTIALMMHIGRVPAYAVGGWFNQETLSGAALLVVAIVIGNALGTRLRRHLSDRWLLIITYLTLLAAVTMAWLGVTSS